MDKDRKEIIKYCDEAIETILEDMEFENEVIDRYKIEAYELTKKFFRERYDNNLRHYGGDKKRMDNYLLDRDIQYFRVYSEGLYSLSLEDNMKTKVISKELKNISNVIFTDLDIYTGTPNFRF